MTTSLANIELGPDIFADQRMLILAREIASDIHPIEEIIKRHGITQEQFEVIVQNSHFQRILADAATVWSGASNTGERIKIKSLVMLEEWLATVFAMLHDPKHTLRDKVELAKLVGRFAGMGEKGPMEVGSGERISININMGDMTREVKTDLVIEHEPVAA